LAMLRSIKKLDALLNKESLSVEAYDQWALQMQRGGGLHPAQADVVVTHFRSIGRGEGFGLLVRAFAFSILHGPPTGTAPETYLFRQGAAQWSCRCSCPSPRTSCKRPLDGYWASGR
jgi:hypothetical protein